MADGSPIDPSHTPASPSLRIMHVTDIHFGDADPVRLEAALEAIDTLKPDCVVLTGDLTQAGRKREFLQAAEWLKKIKAPIVAAPGNHDTPVYTLHQRVFDPFGRYRNLGLADFWTGKEGLAAVASVNTARAMQLRRDWSQGVFNIEHVEEAHGKLVTAAPTGWRFLACHHPPFTPTEAQVESRTRRSAKALQLLHPPERSVVLCGHVHGFFMMEDGASGVRIIAAPSLASSRERGAGAGFVLIDATPKALAVQRWRHDGKAFSPDAAISTLAAPEAVT
jgi:3',5'-cyclic AMP phosphodiesterase CpdA